MLENVSSFGSEWLAEVLASAIGIALGAIVPVMLFLQGQSNDRRKQVEESRRARDEAVAERRRQHDLFLAEREEKLAKECAALIQGCTDEWRRAKREARFKVVKSKLDPSKGAGQADEANRGALREWIADTIDPPGVEHLDAARARLFTMGESGREVRARVLGLKEALHLNWLELEVDLLRGDLASISGDVDAIIASFPDSVEDSTLPVEHPTWANEKHENVERPTAAELWRRMLDAVGPQYRELELTIAELMSFTSSARTRIAFED